jgi:hypothetical protein
VAVKKNSGKRRSKDHGLFLETCHKNSPHEIVVVKATGSFYSKEIYSGI